MVADGLAKHDRRWTGRSALRGAGVIGDARDGDSFAPDVDYGPDRGAGVVDR